MELLIVLVLAAGGVYLLFKMMFKEDHLNSPRPSVPDTTTVINNKSGEVASNPLDVNKDGHVDVKDAVEVVKKTRTRVKKVLDQDGDGKVTVKDAEVVASKATAKGKQIAAKTRGRKTASK